MGGGVQSGLAGVVSHRSSISSIIGATLTYRGINIDELAENAAFEEVVGLLWDGVLPGRARLEALRAALRSELELPDAVVRALRAFPPEGEPMRVLQAAMSLLGTVDPDRDDDSGEGLRRKAPRITSQLTAALCAFHRLRTGKELVAPAPDLSFAGNFFLLLNGRRPKAVEESAFDKALILHADHELNASTFAARVTASTLADAHTALAAAIGTLKGPLHGGANRAVMESLQEIGSLERVDAWLEAKLARREKVMGIGHRVYKEGDPRAKHLKRMSQQLCEATGQPHWYAISERIESLMRARKGLLPNVDFYSATTYFCLGIPPDLYTPIFAASRVVGWLAHLFEQYADNDLIRPRALYEGPQEAHWVPLHERPDL
jgi:citrate synthase